MDIKRFNLALQGILICLLFSGCVTSQSPQEKMARDHLASVQAAYSLARADPQIEANAPEALADAGKTLEAAAQVQDYYEIDHLAYMAQRQMQIAEAMARIKTARRKSDELRQENSQLIEQLSVRARQAEDPEAARREERAAAEEERRQSSPAQD